MSALILDRASGLVLECPASAAALLGGAELAGRSWLDVLAVPEPLAPVFKEALSSRFALGLPDMLYTGPGGEECIVGGLLGGSDDRAELRLVHVADRHSDFVPAGTAPGDVVAVLALDRLHYGPAWTLRDTDRLALELRAALGQLLRQGDTVGSPLGGALALRLGNVEPREAADLLLALLSHLRALLGARQDSAVSARLCAGLAACTGGSGPMSALSGALNALARCQLESPRPAVAWARPDDAGVLLSAAIGAAARQQAGRQRNPGDAGRPVTPPIPGTGFLEKGIEGYVTDNMEGAIDQALFLSGVDIPVAIIGASGTGKLYIARIIHKQAGGAPDDFRIIDCRQFRGRREAMHRIATELEQGEGRTLVFKSPHLMHPEAQRKLARQISSRTLADTEPPRYLPRVRLVALFPDTVEHLLQYGGLEQPLASVFAGYPILVPALRDRDRAVLRWAHKILGQEAAARDRQVEGFTPDAEQVLRSHGWPGNISEMRAVIAAALDNTDRPWITPVDLGLFKGVGEGAGSPGVGHRPYLVVAEEIEAPVENYAPTTLEELSAALARALGDALRVDQLRPLGIWLDDEIVLAACDRYRSDMPAAARLLQVPTRNIGRWMPQILARDHERHSSLLWQEPRKLVRQWIQESGPTEASPRQLAQDALLGHVQRQCGDLTLAQRARIVGVSLPTYKKRLQEWRVRQAREVELDGAG